MFQESDMMTATEAGCVSWCVVFSHEIIHVTHFTALLDEQTPDSLC
jgi:hypothetical protein